MPLPVSLSKWKKNKEIHHVLYFIISGHMKIDKNISPRLLRSPLRWWWNDREFLLCPCFQVHQITVVRAIIPRRTPYWKNILYSAPSIGLSKFTVFFLGFPHHVAWFEMGYAYVSSLALHFLLVISINYPLHNF